MAHRRVDTSVHNNLKNAVQNKPEGKQINQPRSSYESKIQVNKVAIQAFFVVLVTFPIIWTEPEEVRNVHGRFVVKASECEDEKLHY